MSRKILIVDDDLESLKLVGLMLQRRGFEIVSVHSGNQALAQAEAEKPDLIILDVMMPDMDGYQVCQKLRSNPATAFMPVIMFTAKTLVGDKVAGFQAGADDYLTKPIHPTELVSRVEALLQRSELARAEVEPKARARVIGVLGAKGGVGTSTLAVNLALAAVQIKDPQGELEQPKRVSIVELRSGPGAVSLLLGQDPQDGWASLLSQGADALDQETVDSQLLTYMGAVRYLPAPHQSTEGTPVLPQDHVQAVLKHAVLSCDYLYLDLGCVLDGTTARATGLCDVLVVVVEPERLCLMLAQDLLARVEALDAPPGAVHVVMVERWASDANFTPEEVKGVLGHDLAGVIKPAGTVAQQAVEQGQPMVLLDPESKVCGQLADLSRALLK